MILEIDSSPIFPCELFDSNSISVGMKRDVPGGAKIELGELPLQKRDIGAVQCLVPIVLTFGRDVVVGVLVSWLYEKLTTKHVRELLINHTRIEITEEAITKVIIESTKIRENQ
jgi:hypothetical protein